MQKLKLNIQKHCWPLWAGAHLRWTDLKWRCVRVHTLNKFWKHLTLCSKASICDGTGCIRLPPTMFWNSMYCHSDDTFCFNLALTSEHIVAHALYKKSYPPFPLLLPLTPSASFPNPVSTVEMGQKLKARYEWAVSCVIGSIHWLMIWCMQARE